MRNRIAWRPLSEHLRAYGHSADMYAGPLATTRLGSGANAAVGRLCWWRPER
jgi:hypothetical protein